MHFGSLRGSQIFAITRVASMGVIKLLPIHRDVEEKSDFFADHPFYSKVIIPSGTYHGVDYDVVTYQDSTFLTAGRNVSVDAVEKYWKQSIHLMAWLTWLGLNQRQRI